MTEQDNNVPEKPREEAGQAVFRPSRWPGLIWAVPAAALGIVGWLAISSFVHSGPTVTVTFPIAGGLQAGNSKVEYQGFQVGQVSSVKLDKSLHDMIVKIDFDSEMSGHLGRGTQYWLSGTSLSLSDLSSIKEMISGPVIGVEPRLGKTVDHAAGLGKPPVLKDEPQGETLTLLADKLSNISPGSPVYFNGYKVGEVRGLDMRPDGKKFDIYAFIEKKHENLVDSNSRFWDAGGVRLSSGGGGPGIQLQSIPALILGAVAFETPDYPNAKNITNGARFELYCSKGAAEAAPGPGAVLYRVVFAGGPNGLKAGAAVELEGAPAGAVKDVQMQYDPAQASVQTVADLVLQPEKISLAGAAWNLENPRPQMDAILNRLVAQGLRAKIGSVVPVVGGKLVQLSVVKGQPSAALIPGEPPQIPSFGGGGADQIIMQINDILATVNAMPLDQIATDIHQATARLAKLSKSPQTRRTLQNLDRTVAHVADITRQTDAQLPEILFQVKRSAAEAQAALTQAQGMLSVAGPANASPELAGLPHTLYELSQAAESLRALTDFLNSHPDALIAGRQD